jgi:hypothetical protein
MYTIHQGSISYESLGLEIVATRVTYFERTVDRACVHTQSLMRNDWPRITQHNLIFKRSCTDMRKAGVKKKSVKFGAKVDENEPVWTTLRRDDGSITSEPLSDRSAETSSLEIPGSWHQLLVAFRDVVFIPNTAGHTLHLDRRNMYGARRREGLGNWISKDGRHI